MSVTITLTDDLAKQLSVRAETNQISVEDLALRILNDAMDESDPEWLAHNDRRIFLIDKSFAHQLSKDEAEELQHLQNEADRHLEALDQQMLKDVRHIREVALSVLGSTIHSNLPAGSALPDRCTPLHVGDAAIPWRER